MAFQRVGILSIGEMGYHWARLLASHGVEVLTYTKGRSEVTRKRAENAGARSVPSMAQLVSQSDVVVSVVVPSGAKRVAAKVAKALVKAGRKDLLFLDANATSPMTAREIERHLSPASANFVDGCIIGSAAKVGKGTVVYASGPQAAVSNKTSCSSTTESATLRIKVPYGDWSRHSRPPRAPSSPTSRVTDIPISSFPASAAPQRRCSALDGTNFRRCAWTTVTGTAPYPSPSFKGQSILRSERSR